MAEPSRASGLAGGAQCRPPRAGRLERRGKLHALITQNIDGLHQRAGNDPARVIEVHGTLHGVCLHAQRLARPDAGRSRTRRAGEEDPRCEACGGILKSATISFGQPLFRR